MAGPDKGESPYSGLTYLIEKFRLTLDTYVIFNLYFLPLEM